VLLKVTEPASIVEPVLKVIIKCSFVIVVLVIETPSSPSIPFVTVNVEVVLSV
jgi:hypothetical protein